MFFVGRDPERKNPTSHQFQSIIGPGFFRHLDHHGSVSGSATSPPCGLGI